MANPPVPAPANPAQDENADSTPDNPNAPAPANPVGPTMPVPNQPGPHQPVPNQPAPMQPAPAAPQMIHQQVLNWSHFKPESVGRPEEDAKAHLLYTNDWMAFPQDLKVQRLCLTLTGEGRLRYESLTPIAKRSFHYDENTETVDAYVNRIRQVVAMLGYGESHILEVFKNTIPN